MGNLSTSVALPLAQTVSNDLSNQIVPPKLSRANSKATAKKASAKSKQIEEEKKESAAKSEPVLDPKSNELYKNMTKHFKPKPFTDLTASNCAQVSQYIEVTILELLTKVKEEEAQQHRKLGEEENCPICMCELYDDLEKKSEQEIKDIHEKQMRQEIPIDVVIMSKCTDHCFHKQCLEAQIGQQDNVRCAVCSQIYGVLMGQMPGGTMEWKLTPKSKHNFCDGYEGFGVWEIRYIFPDGKKDGVKYRGTRRHAYLPDTPEGRESLALLVKSFERRMSFVVGTSVTTGEKNVVVWSVHHKTNTTGGTSSFGYPDPTYFNRLKLELADRGVALDGQHEVDAISKSHKGLRVA
eukprot:403375785